MSEEMRQGLGWQVQGKAAGAAGGGGWRSMAGPFAGYAPSAGSFDEMLARPDGEAGLWRPLVERLGELGVEGLGEAWKRGQDLLREDGLAYKLLSGHLEEERQWNVDPVPLLLSELEWSGLAAAAVQRARLWDLVLRDIYGEQDLLLSGEVPAGVLYSLGGYQRALRYLPAADRPILGLYAIDLARGPSGSWTVVADRANAPNGMGYALENRLALTRTFPETSKRMRLLRQAGFFQALRERLFSLVPAAVDAPHVVMLTPGPGDPTYFEDAYLSRYLGITLAVGDELTVRGERVFLKTVAGLKRVHVIWRRVEESEIDPLEVPTTSHRGVPGLLQAMRAGTVEVVNPPGTGLIEAAVWLPYLDRLSRRLLGEELLLPSVETRWGGLEGEGLLGALGDGSHVLKGAFSREGFPRTLLRTLGAAERGEVERAVREQPQRFVLQREIAFSSAPVWDGAKMEPRPVAVRLFVIADQDGYRVMPGGLVRCAPAAGELPGLSIREDSSSKDLWVLSGREQPQPPSTNLPKSVAVRRGVGTLSSRAADNLYWIGRYSERAEFATRILQEIVRCHASERDGGGRVAAAPLMAVLEEQDYLEPGSEAGWRGVSWSVLDASLSDILLPVFYRQASASVGSGKVLDSVSENVARLKGLAALSRDRLSGETWRIVRELDGLVGQPPPQDLLGFLPVLQRALLDQSAFNGTCRENITRSEGWRFLTIGRRLERASWLASLIGRLLSGYPALPSAALDAALAVTDCTLTYRFRYHGAPRVVPLLDLLLFDPSNPRGMAFQLGELDRDMGALPAAADGMLRAPHRTVLRSYHPLITEGLQASDDQEELEAVGWVRGFVDRLRVDLPSLSEQLGWEFFTHTSFTSS